MMHVFDNPHTYRGFLISTFAELETAINICLALHFKSDFKNDEIIEILIDRLTFEAKRTACKTILEKDSILNGFVKTKNNKFPHNKLLDEIRQLNEIRVQFAHFILADKYIHENYVIALVEFRNSTAVWEYSQHDYDSIIERIERADDEIYRLFRHNLKST